MKTLFKHALVGVMLALSANVMAASVEVANTDSGWYTKPGLHPASIKNYYASENSGQRNYFVFDVSAIDTSAVTDATFTFFSYNISDAGTFTLFNVATDSITLSAQTPAGPAGAAINQDLGDGDIYGSVLLNTSDSNSFITITLNSSFINALKSSSGTISLGGTFAGTTNTAAFAFANSAFNSNNVLTLTSPVPESQGSSLFLVGLLLVGAAYRTTMRGSNDRHIHY